MVDCQTDTQVQRVVQRNQLKPDAIQQIIAQQASRAQRLACADAVIYNDGIETVIIMASIFGAQVLGMQTHEIILFFLMIQAIAFLGSLAFGCLSDAIGSRDLSY